MVRYLGMAELAATRTQACKSEAILVPASNGWPLPGRLSSQAGAIESCGSSWTRPLVARSFGEGSSQGSADGKKAPCDFTNIETAIKD